MYNAGASNLASPRDAWPSVIVFCLRKSSGRIRHFIGVSSSTAGERLGREGHSVQAADDEDGDATSTVIMQNSFSGALGTPAALNIFPD